jgi:hypothetical protein
MKSYEVLREVVEKVGVKSLAAKLKLSQAMVYKWCDEPSQDAGRPRGATNPLDRVNEIMAHTGCDEPARWLCQQVGGFFVKNPPMKPHHIDSELLMDTQKLVEEFSQLLLTVTRSVEDDGQIRPEEAERIRRAWERLKSRAEGFTVAGERGQYQEG